MCIRDRGTTELDHDGLVELIIGRPLGQLVPDLPAPRTRTALEVRGITSPIVQDASFAVREGEILGVTGLVGSGYETILKLIFGAQPRDGGEVLIAGRSIDTSSPRASIREGLAFAPADRTATTGPDIPPLGTGCRPRPAGRRDRGPDG